MQMRQSLATRLEYRSEAPFSRSLFTQAEHLLDRPVAQRALRFIGARKQWWRNGEGLVARSHVSGYARFVACDLGDLATLPPNSAIASS